MKKLFGGLCLAASLVAVGASANAAQIESTSALTFDGVTSNFGSSFGADTKGKTFLSNYTFDYGNPFAVSSAVISIALNKMSSLDIGSFTLSGNGNTYTGSKSTIGNTQFFTLSASNLASGLYTLSVAGTVTGHAGGSFGGNISVAAVPEASTTAMMIGGLALVGFGVARRRRNGGKSSSGMHGMTAA